MAKVGEPFSPYRLFVGSYIPNVLLHNPDLTAGAKLVWARLSQYAGKDGVAWPKQETLASELGIHRNSIGRHLGELVKQGFLRVHKPQGTALLRHESARYEFLWHPSFEETGASLPRHGFRASESSKIVPPYEENQKDEENTAFEAAPGAEDVPPDGVKAVGLGLERAKPHPPRSLQKKFLRHYYHQWKKMYGHECPREAAGIKDFVIAADICSRLNQDWPTIEGVLTRYFADRTPFFHGHPLPKLLNQLLTFVAPEAVSEDLRERREMATWTPEWIRKNAPGLAGIPMRGTVGDNSAEEEEEDLS